MAASPQSVGPATAEDFAQTSGSLSAQIAAMRLAQKQWASQPLEQRLTILRRFRHTVASRPQQAIEAISGQLQRTAADTLAAELLPLLDACKFLEAEAEEILGTHRLGSHRRAFWLRGLQAEVHRDPLGLVLLLAPFNYPLFLPGVQALQALAAGNCCVWKPAEGGAPVARWMREMLVASGLNPLLLHVADPTTEAAQQLLRLGADKVFLTGSVATGQAVLRQLAESITPAVMELSGCDAVFVLPGADLDRVTKALVFGIQLNGGATCMAPRRVFVARPLLAELENRLTNALREAKAVKVDPAVRNRLDFALHDAQRQGAVLLLDGREHEEGGLRPTVLSNVTPGMQIAQTETFAPVLSLLAWESEEDALRAYEACPFALTASIFGPERHAHAITCRIAAGTVLWNDLIVPTADARLPFGGRRRSGYGVTRGREGLLEMTAVKVVLRRRGYSTRHFQPTGEFHAEMFSGVIAGVHGDGFLVRWRGWLRAMRAAMRIDGNSGGKSE